MASTTSTTPDFDGFTLRNVEWATYRKLRDNPAHDRLRMTYLDGKLTILLSVFEGEGLTLRDVEWEFYCRLRDEPSHGHLRMTYLDGDLTIMSPEYRHDGNARRIYEVITTVAGVWEIDYMPIGTTTLRSEGRAPLAGAAKEADEGFYLGDDEARVRDNEDINLAVDPPPTLAVEVDNWAASDHALPAYARIGVPEVWLYKAKKHTLRFHRLVDGRYVEVGRSVAQPRLTPALVIEALDARAGGMGDRLWARWLEGWARALPEPPPAAD